MAEVMEWLILVGEKELLWQNSFKRVVCQVAMKSCCRLGELKGIVDELTIQRCKQFLVSKRIDFDTP